MYLYTRRIFCFSLPKNPVFFPLQVILLPNEKSWLRAWHSACWVWTNIRVIVKINRRPCVARLQKSIKSDKKQKPISSVVQGTKAQIQYRSQQHLEARVEPESEDLLADEKKARCKAARQLDKAWWQLSISQRRLPITGTCREEPRQHRSAPSYRCGHGVFSGLKTPLFSPSKSHSSIKSTQSTSSLGCLFQCKVFARFPSSHKSKLKDNLQNNLLQFISKNVEAWKTRIGWGGAPPNWRVQDI